jgi:hypothetical protein
VADPTTTRTGSDATHEPVSPSFVTDADDITDVNEQEEVLPGRFSITAYGADFLVDGLVNRLQAGRVSISPRAVQSSSSSRLSTQNGVVLLKRSSSMLAAPQSSRSSLGVIRLPTATRLASRMLRSVSTTWQSRKSFDSSRTSSTLDQCGDGLRLEHGLTAVLQAETTVSLPPRRPTDGRLRKTSWRGFADFRSSV